MTSEDSTRQTIALAVITALIFASLLLPSIIAWFKSRLTADAKQSLCEAQRNVTNLRAAPLPYSPHLGNTRPKLHLIDATPLYEDRHLTIDQDGFFIRRYYFPFGFPRQIPWSKIAGARDEPLTRFNGKYRFWGLGLDLRWFPLDWSRPKKRRVVTLNTDTIVRVALTPENPERVLGLLMAHFSAQMSQGILR